MKTIGPLLCALALLCAGPVFAADTTLEVEAAEPAVDVVEGVEAVETASSACGSEEIELPEPMSFAGRVDASWGCYQCCSGCDDVSSRIPCDEWCGCSCSDNPGPP